jgi:hypothetical protein
MNLILAHSRSKGGHAARWNFGEFHAGREFDPSSELAEA